MVAYCLVDVFFLDDSWTPVPEAVELYEDIDNLQFSHADINFCCQFLLDKPAPLPLLDLLTYAFAGSS